ncbi:hypothetical protein [Streptomyces sp. CoH17]|uniref:hypothetical protein n=1 Tax=Streptomyces sp. CoH17 TaxID=2992806 RepID=UPI00226D639D|nr:hypothetical protein [Streptomyces sp. CoH17]
MTDISINHEEKIVLRSHELAEAHDQEKYNTLYLRYMGATLVAGGQESAEHRKNVKEELDQFLKPFLEQARNELRPEVPKVEVIGTGKVPFLVQ